MELTTCIKKAGKALSGADAKAIKASRKSYIDDGLSPSEAAQRAVIARIEDALKDRMDLSKRISDEGGVNTLPPTLETFRKRDQLLRDQIAMANLPDKYPKLEYDRESTITGPLPFLSPADFEEIVTERDWLFPDPKKGETVSLATNAQLGKAELWTKADKDAGRIPKGKTEGYYKGPGNGKYVTEKEAAAKLKEWKQYAAEQATEVHPGRGANRDKIVLSFFDLTGAWVQPYRDAGYQVYTFDLQSGQDVNDFSVEYFTENFDFLDIFAIFAACPCTDFTNSGNRWKAAKREPGGPIDQSKQLVYQTLRTIEYFRPQIWAIENPVGQIEGEVGLPPWRLSFHPHHFGDNYTKKTNLWGNFNPNLPTSNRPPTEGSKMFTQHGGGSVDTKNQRSETPEGFAYAFFRANNAIGMTTEEFLFSKYTNVKPAIQAALDKGMTEAEIVEVMDDTWDFDGSEAAQALYDATAAKVSPEGDYPHGDPDFDLISGKITQQEYNERTDGGGEFATDETVEVDRATKAKLSILKSRLEARLPRKNVNKEIWNGDNNPPASTVEKMDSAKITTYIDMGLDGSKAPEDRGTGKMLEIAANYFEEGSMQSLRKAVEKLGPVEGSQFVRNLLMVDLLSGGGVKIEGIDSQVVETGIHWDKGQIPVGQLDQAFDRTDNIWNLRNGDMALILRELAIANPALWQAMRDNESVQAFQDPEYHLVPWTEKAETGRGDEQRDMLEPETIPVVNAGKATGAMDEAWGAEMAGMWTEMTQEDSASGPIVALEFEHTTVFATVGEGLSYLFGMGGGRQKTHWGDFVGIYPLPSNIFLHPSRVTYSVKDTNKIKRRQMVRNELKRLLSKDGARLVDRVNKGVANVTPEMAQKGLSVSSQGKGAFNKSKKTFLRELATTERERPSMQSSRHKSMATAAGEYGIYPGDADLIIEKTRLSPMAFFDAVKGNDTAFAMLAERVQSAKPDPKKHVMSPDDLVKTTQKERYAQLLEARAEWEAYLKDNNLESSGPAGDLFGIEEREGAYKTGERQLIAKEHYRPFKRNLDNLNTEESKALRAYLKGRPDAKAVRANLKKHAGTPFADQALEGIFVRQAMRELIAGHEPTFQSIMDSPSAAKTREILRVDGEAGLWTLLEMGNRGLIGSAAKPVNAVNSSFALCDPSKDCASTCYATGGNYRQANPIVKSELVTLAVEADPRKAGKMIADEYKTTAEYLMKKALRVFDKGDGSPAWIDVIRTMNINGVRAHVFSKKADFLRALPPTNIRLLSIDESNMDLARENQDLKVALTYSGEQQIPDALELFDRGQLQVVLPLKLGKKLLNKSSVTKLEKAVPGVKRHVCPLDKGVKKIGKGKDGFNCTKCDVGGGIGCYTGDVTKSLISAIMSEPTQASKRMAEVMKLQEAIRERIEQTGDVVAADGRPDEGGLQGLLSQADTLMGELVTELGGEGEVQFYRPDGTVPGQTLEDRGGNPPEGGGVGERSEAEISQAGRSPGAGVGTGSDAVETIGAGYEISEEQMGLFDNIPKEEKKPKLKDLYATTVANRPIGKLRTGTTTIKSPEDLAHLIAPLRKKAQEKFIVVATDAQDNILLVSHHTTGLKSSSAVDPLTVVAQVAGIEGATTIHYGHNHPSGKATPSGSDEVITSRLERMLDGTGIQFGHHVVVGGTDAALVLDQGIEHKVKITPMARTKSVPVMEREIVSNKKLGPAITGPQAAMMIIEATKVPNAIVLLDVQHHPVGVVNMLAQDMQALRDNGNVRRIMKAIDKTNASAALIKADSKESARNVASFLNGSTLRLLDAAYPGGPRSKKLVMDSTQGDPVSSADHGFAMASRARTGIPVEDVQSVVDRLTAKWQDSSFVSVVQSINELPAKDQAEIRKQGLDVIAGYYDRQDQKIYMVAEGIATKRDAEIAFAHEAMGHLGIEAVLGDDVAEFFYEVMIEIKNDSRLAEAWDYVSVHYADTPLVGQIAETVARIAETSPKHNIVQRVFQWVRQKLREFGVRVPLRHGDIVSLLHRASENFETGEFAGKSGKGTLFRRGNVAKPATEAPAQVQPEETGTDLLFRKVTDGRDRLNDEIRTENKTVFDRAYNYLRRGFTPGGMMPKEFFDSKIARDAELNAHEMEVRAHIWGLERAYKAAYGKDYNLRTAEQEDTLSAALAGSVQASKALPQDVAVEVEKMRQFIDGMSDKYLGILKTDGLKLLAGLDPDRAQEVVSAINAGDYGALRTKEEAQIAQKWNMILTINGNRGEYVHRSYRAFDDKAWAKKVPDEILNDARDYISGQLLAQDPGISAKDIGLSQQRIIESIIKEGTAFGGIEQFIVESKLGARDLSILKRRNESMAPEIRKLLGEYIDPRINFAKSVSKMARLIYNDVFLKDIKKNGLGVHLFEPGTQPPGYWEPLSASSGEAYEPLNGLMTTPDIKQAFIDAMGDQGKHWYDPIVQANGLVKANKTILSPTTAARNWLSAFFFTVANSHFDITKMKKSFNSAHAYFTHHGESLEYLKKLQRLGVIYDNPYAGELMDLLKDAKAMDSIVTGKIPGRNLFRRAQQFYQFGDDFWKIIGFENEVGTQMEYYNLSREDAEVKAAERIRNTYPTYSMVGRNMRFLRKFPLAGTFVSFPSEIIRTTSHILRYAAEDAKQSKSLGAKRLTGIMLASAAMYATQELSKQALGVDDDEEEAIRDQLPPWSKNSNLMFVGREKGNMRYLDLSFIDPYNYWKRPITAVMRDEPLEDKLKSAAVDAFSPFFGRDIAAGAIFDAFRNKKPTGGRVYNPSETTIEQAKEIATYISKAVQPGFMANIQRFAKAASDDIPSSGRVYSVEDEAWALAGFRFGTLDPGRSLFFATKDAANSLSDASSVRNAAVRNPNIVSEDTLRRAFDRNNAIREEAYGDLLDAVSSARKNGLTTPQVIKQLRGAGLSKRDAYMLAKGRIPRKIPPSTWMRDTVISAKDAYGPEGQRNILAKRRKMLEWSRDYAKQDVQP